MAHLFFPYAHLDQDRLIAFQQRFEVRTGRMLWIDKVGLQHDAAWQDMIRRAIVGSYGVIFALTANFADETARWFIHQREIPWALERFNAERHGTLLFVVRFDDVPVPPALADPALRYTVQVIDAFDRPWEDVIDALDGILPSIPVGVDQPFVVLWNRLRNFKGRDDALIDLHQKLIAADGRVGIKTAGLHGTGGIGKTQLAVEYAYRFRFYYPKGVFWINAAADWKAEFADRADRLGLPPVEMTDKDDRAGGMVIALKQHLTGGDGAALIVLDNVDDPRAVLTRPLVANLTVRALCDAIGARLILTTRVQTLPDGFGAVAVSKLSPADARAVLRDAWTPGETTAARTDAPDAAALDAIAALFDYLPLPLGWMAAALRQKPTLQPGKLLESLKAGGVDATIARLKQARVVLGTPDYYEALVGSALNWQIGQLNDPNAVTLLQLIAAYGEAAIVPRARLRLLVQFDTDDLLDPFDEAIDRLQQYSLAEAQDGAAAFRLHPLTRDHVRRAYGAGAALAAAAPELTRAVRTPQTFESECAARGFAALLADVEATASALNGGDDGLAGLLRLLLLESHRLLNPPEDPAVGFYAAQLRDRARYEGDADLVRACDDWLADTPHLRAAAAAPRRVASPYLVRTLKGHTGEVGGALTLADGRLLSWSWDKTLRPWTADGAPLAILAGHTSVVWGALALADGRLLSWSGDSTLRLWTADGAPLAVLEGHTGWVNGVLALADGRLLSWAEDTTLRLWTADGAPLAILEGHTHSVSGALALANGRLLSWSERESTLRLWTADGAPLAILEGHTEWVRGGLALADGRLLSWSWDSTLRLWTADGAPLAVLEGHTDMAWGALALADGRLLSSADKTLRLWTADGAPLAVLEGHTSTVRGALALADGRLLSWSDDTTLRLWTADGAPLAVLAGHTDRVWGALALADGRLLSWADDATLRLWRIPRAAGDSAPPTQDHPAVAADPARVSGILALADGRLLSWSDKTLRLWTADGAPLAVLEGHTKGVNGVLALADGRLLSWSGDRTLRLWTADGAPLAVLEGHTDAARGALALADGRLLSWSEDKTLRLWTADGAPLAVLEGHVGSVNSALALADGRLLSWSNRESTLRLWTADGAERAVLKGHMDSVWGALALADGRLLSWSRDTTLLLWTADGALLAVLVGHTDAVWDALTLADGRLLSWSWDSTLRLWTADGAPLAVLAGHTDEVHGALALADGRLLSWSRDGEYRLWTADGAPIGGPLGWRDTLSLPHQVEGNARWWDYGGDLVRRGDVATGRVDALYLHDGPIAQIARLSPTRCALLDAAGRLYFLEYHDGRVARAAAPRANRGPHPFQG